MQPNWATCTSSRSGVSCGRKRSTSPDASPGAKATIPQFIAKAADVVRLSIAPPENAIVICVDEKPSIQALESVPKGYLKLPNGRALTGHSHDYKRNGTTTLFAAFEVATGKGRELRTRRHRRRIEFLDFMNDIVVGHPDTAIHVVLDNLNTHKPKNDRWLKRHRTMRFHFTPTRASWLNRSKSGSQSWKRQSLHGASFTSVAQLREHIDAFIDAYNENAQPFVWTKPGSISAASRDAVSVNCDSGY
ncbi:MAG: IS630 family transposase [Xanthobacteraceae bacterium]